MLYLDGLTQKRKVQQTQYDMQRRKQDEKQSLAQIDKHANDLISIVQKAAKDGVIQTLPAKTRDEMMKSLDQTLQQARELKQLADSLHVKLELQAVELKLNDAKKLLQIQNPTAKKRNDF